ANRRVLHFTACVATEQSHLVTAEGARIHVNGIRIPNDSILIVRKDGIRDNYKLTDHRIGIVLESAAVNGGLDVCVVGEAPGIISQQAVRNRDMRKRPVPNSARCTETGVGMFDRGKPDRCDSRSYDSSPTPFRGRGIV